MTRIRFDPDAVRDAGVAFVAAGDDLATGASALGSMALPSMPAAMSSRYAAEIAAHAARLRALCGEQAKIGEELQTRAGAAELADDGKGAVHGGDGRRLERALGSVAVVGAAGVAHSARVRIAGGQVTVTSSSGLTLSTSVSELGLKPAQASATETHRTTSPGEGAEVPGSPAPSQSPAQAGAPQGGLAATTVADAISPPPEPDGASGEAGLRASESDGQGGQPVQQPMPTSADAERQDWGCWMAGSAAHAGVPPSLPLMLALSSSGMHNMPADGSTAGFFGMETGAAGAPPGHGLPPGAQPDASWWAERPDAQLDHVLRRLREVSGGTRDAELGDARALERWAQDAGLAADGQRLVEAQQAADAMVSNCAESGGSGRSGGEGGALGIARSQLGVHEAGVNSGAEVNRFLAAAETAPGNPWCASFVTWSLEQDGHEMQGDGWAAVQRWVSAAGAGEQGLSIVDAAHARPGDIVAYDWGGGSDFGQDGHIGFLESEVRDGRFTAVEGNANDAVSRMQRGLDQGNVVFIRVDG